MLVAFETSNGGIDKTLSCEATPPSRGAVLLLNGLGPTRQHDVATFDKLYLHHCRQAQVKIQRVNSRVDEISTAAKR